MDVFSWPLQEVAATWALGFDRVLFYEMDAQGSGVFVSQWWPDNVVYQSAKTNTLKFQYLIHCLETALF